MWDVGRTREEFVKNEPQASDLQILRVFYQHSKWFIMPINHRNLWSIAFT